MENELNDKYYLIDDLENERYDLKSQVTKLQLHIQGEELLRRTNKVLGDKIAQDIIINKWDHYYDLRYILYGENSSRRSKESRVGS